MLTSTLTLFRSGLTSSTVPMNSANGPVGDPDALALGEGHPELGGLDAHLAEDLLDLVLVERDRLAPHARDVGAADEARHARRVADDEPAVRVEGHLDEDVARVDLLLDGVALALADLDLVLHRDEDLEDLVLHAHRLDAMLEIGLDLVLVARVRVDHVPALLGRLVVAVSVPLVSVIIVRLTVAAEQLDGVEEDRVEEGDEEPDDEAHREDEHGQVARLRDGRPGDLLEFRPRLVDESTGASRRGD